MKQASTEAYAKINLTLDVTGKRPNGYHDVCMVMQSIGIHDIVTVQTETGADDIELTISHCDLPTDSSNLAYRAAQLVFAALQQATNGIVFTSKSTTLRRSGGRQHGCRSSAGTAQRPVSDRTDTGTAHGNGPGTGR